MSARPPKGGAYRELIQGRQFIVLDIETTETKATTQAAAVTYPVTIGVVVLQNDTRRDPQHFIANPGVPMDKRSSDHNGIKTADLVGRQPVAAMLDQLDTYLAAYPDAYLVCHNANFDIRHLHAAYARDNKTPFDRPVIDTQFLPKRLKLEGLPLFVKLDAMRARYAINTTVTPPKSEAKLWKGLKDAQDTAELLGWLMAEAAAAGMTSFDDFLTTAKPRGSVEIASAYHRRRVPMARPTITATHLSRFHRSTRLKNPTPARYDRWIADAKVCIGLHCPHLVERTTSDDKYAAELIDRLTPLLRDCTKPGDLGTLLGALEPLVRLMPRDAARSWARLNLRHIRAGAACTPLAACPACVADQSCPKDTFYHLLTRRSVDYGLTTKGDPVSLLSKEAKKDLWDGSHWRAIDTWPRTDRAEMAAHMVWIVLGEARRKRQTTTETKLLTKAHERDLHLEDPRLTLELARHWSTNPERDAEVEQFVTAVLAKATSDPGYAQLEFWFHGAYQRLLATRDAVDHRKVRPRVKNPKRRPAPIELRPAEAQRTYRYQIHRRPTGT